MLMLVLVLGGGHRDGLRGPDLSGRWDGLWGRRHMRVWRLVTGGGKVVPECEMISKGEVVAE